MRHAPCAATVCVSPSCVEVLARHPCIHALAGCQHHRPRLLCYWQNTDVNAGPHLHPQRAVTSPSPRGRRPPDASHAPNHLRRPTPTLDTEDSDNHNNSINDGDSTSSGIVSLGRRSSSPTFRMTKCAVGAHGSSRRQTWRM